MSTYTIRTEGTRLIVSEDGVDCCRFASPAAALELAARLREVAEGLLPPVTPESIEEWAARRRAEEDAALMENRKCAAMEMQSRPPFPPEQVAEMLHATYDGDERGLWEDSHP